MRTSTIFQSTIALLFILSLTTTKAQEKNNRMSALNTHQQTLASISALTATGNLPELKSALNKGLDAGLTINEIKESLVQLYAYCGFPRSLNGISTLMTVIEERKDKNIKDPEGKSATPVKDSNKYESGKRNLQQLTGIEEKGPKTGANAFAPVIDVFWKEHLFADIFNRDVLNFRQREFVTISALAAMPGVEPQLKAHLSMAKNIGITDLQLVELAGVIEMDAGRTQANILRRLIAQPELPVIQPDMMIRISEIEIIPEYLEEYKTILQQESSQSVKMEPGVISIFPMYQKENPKQFRLLEIYANAAAYQSHLQSVHFKHYKSTTLKMVKSLKLVDMAMLDPETIELIFEKLK